MYSPGCLGRHGWCYGFGLSNKPCRISSASPSQQGVELPDGLASKRDSSCDDGYVMVAVTIIVQLSMPSPPPQLRQFLVRSPTQLAPTDLMPHSHSSSTYTLFCCIYSTILKLEKIMGVHSRKMGVQHLSP